MAMTCTVAILAGSLRNASLNRRVAHGLVNLGPPSLKLELVDIGGLTLYNDDGDDDPLAPYVAVRRQVAATQALLFVTPEYNRSVPGPLKNALDIGSRPYGHSVWFRKPAAIVSASPGAMGGFGASHRQPPSLVFLDVPTMQQPQA
jgi:chromate reductase